MLEIIVRTQFIGFHCWPDAPEPQAYLRDRHRHTFHVEATKQVTHADRDIEFIELRERVDVWIKERQQQDSATMSCEHWAIAIAEQFDFDAVEVNEDGENGARWSRA